MYPHFVCLMAHINMELAGEITGAFPIMNLHGKKEQGGTL